MSQPDALHIAYEDHHLSFNLEAGAPIVQLILGQNGERHTVIDAVNGPANPWLFPFPNRLAHGEYTFDGKTYRFPINDHDERPNSLHGFIRKEMFSLADKGINEKGSWASLVYDYDGSLVYYPFPFRLTFKYTLSSEGLAIAVTTENTGETNMPAGLGWHPYFALPTGVDGASLKLPACQEIEVDDFTMIPTGKKWPSTCFDSPRNLDGVKLDTCFELNKKDESNSTFVKTEGFEVEIWQDAQHQFIQVFTSVNRKTLAVEPMTCGIDAFNTGEGLKVLKAGESWTVSCGVKLV